MLSFLKEVPKSKIPNVKAEDLPFLDRFMVDQCNIYIEIMEKAYKILDLSKVHTITMEFFKLIVQEIYLDSVSNMLIAYPEEHLSHLAVFLKILECISVVNPLIPFSVMHISEKPSISWPTSNQVDP